MTEIINWLPLSGKVDIANNLISYIPSTLKNINGVEENIVATFASNKNFDNGEIKFNFLFTDKISKFQIVLNSFTSEPQVYIGLNTVDAFSILRLKDSKFDVLSSNGVLGSFNLNTYYDARITVIGSQINLYINGILVSSKEILIKKSQIQIVFFGPSEIKIKDFRVVSQKPKAFVVMQFTEEYNQLYTEVIRPVCESFDLECVRADECITIGSIIEDIINSIKESYVIIADITPNNPNVFYEVGYAHAINKPTILLADKKREKLPFDVSGFRTLFYENNIAGKSVIESKLRRFLDEITLK
ncbi:hypothetical protein CLHUN_42900 [Ruminiclostridium hungatei]|uniref:Nucleoside 2-deoxyribosyltransferase n=1 Tax=Ruminiclostridium hungatei TaxID=48256 RepID=A0A1V4SD50_RUMHU|nr:hypothetical protein [Ruminiclostridium hungatei]OPX41842.1 hypothetical protein CLHUN_42900 [Ruminiclostridium hungatei]